MLEKKVLTFADAFEELSAGAQKEHSLKRALANMKLDWATIKFSTTLYKETRCPILRGIDEIQAVLDDHIVKTQAIRSSPFCKPFEGDVLSWEAKLTIIQEFIDQVSGFGSDDCFFLFLRVLVFRGHGWHWSRFLVVKILNASCRMRAVRLSTLIKCSVIV
jgi:hypothetical protein